MGRASDWAVGKYMAQKGNELSRGKPSEHEKGSRRCVRKSRGTHGSIKQKQVEEAKQLAPAAGEQVARSPLAGPPVVPSLPGLPACPALTPFDIDHQAHFLLN